ncbi:MAG: TlpA disulfide reductase family protein [Bacteroidota bacterium]
MRILLLLFMMPIGLLMGQENTFSLRGHITGLPAGSFLNVMQYSYSTGSTIDTVYIEADTFYYEGRLAERFPQRLGLMSFSPEGPIGSINFWVEDDGGTVMIEGDGPYLANWQATSKGKEQIALNALMTPLQDLTRARDSISKIRTQYIYAYYEEKADQDYAALIKAMDALSDSIDQLYNPIMLRQIKQNPNSFSAVRHFYYLAKFNEEQIGGKKVVQEIFDQIEPPYTESLYAVGLATSLNQPKVPEVGNEMVDLLVEDLDGKTHQLSEFREAGKYMLLDFWSLACGPCVMAAPELRAMQAKYPDQLTIVGLSMDTKYEWWQKATERDSITWTNLSDFKGTFGGAGATYGVQGLPTYVLIGPDGKVAHRWTGFSAGIFEEQVGTRLEE